MQQLARSLKVLLLAAAGCAAGDVFLARQGPPASALPGLTYRYAVFAVDEPAAAAAFLERYTGALRLQPAEHQLAPRANASVAGSRLFYAGGGAYSDVYFVSDPTLPQGEVGPTVYGKGIFDTNTMSPDDWTWHQDWHLAFTVDDVDAVASRLLRDQVPFVNRGGMYFSVPDTGVHIQVLGTASLYWHEPFFFCRRTEDAINGLMKPYATNVTPIDDALARPLPEFVPAHQSMTSSDARACAEWTDRLLKIAKVQPHTEPGGAHAYANGTCGDIRWYEIVENGWELHWIQQFFKREGKVKVAEHERIVRELRGNVSSWDAYFNFRNAFAVKDLQPYIEAFESQAEPFLLSDDGTRMFISAPNGYVFELFREEGLPLTQRGLFNEPLAIEAVASTVHE